MTTYGVVVFHDAETDFRTTADPETADLVSDMYGSMALMIEADSPGAAADAAYVIGNRMGADKDGKTWSPGVRSVSVGDVIFVRDLDAPLADIGEGFAVAGVGFEPYEMDWRAIRWEEGPEAVTAYETGADDA